MIAVKGALLPELIRNTVFQMIREEGDADESSEPCAEAIYAQHPQNSPLFREDEEKYYCPECGAEITLDMTQCPKCGVEFEFTEDEE